MEFSHAFISTMRSFIYPHSGRTNNSSLLLNNYDSFLNKYIKLNISSSQIEFPLVMSGVIESAHSYYNDELVVPLMYSMSFPGVTGAEAALKSFGRTRNLGLHKVSLKNGEVYYGSSGIILDQNLNPILVCYKRKSIGSGIRRDLPGLTLRVSPDIFINPDKSFNKLIVKKIIPYCLTNYYSFWGFPDDVLNGGVNIVVTSDFPSIETITPSIGEENVKDFLLKNSELLLSQFKDYDPGSI